MISLETLEKMIAICAAIIAVVTWSVSRLEKRAKEKEAARLWAKHIEEKLLNLEANNGRLTEELEDVRKDFASFVQQLLFKK